MEKAKEKWMPVKDYAIIAGITVQAVYYQVRNGLIKSKKIGTYTLVSA